MRSWSAWRIGRHNDDLSDNPYVRHLGLKDIRDIGDVFQVQPEPTAIPCIAGARRSVIGLLFVQEKSVKTIDVPIALGALAALSACQLPAAPLPNPNQHEASKAIGRVLRAGDVAAWSIPEGQPTNCVPGTMDNTEVRSCKVCASIVYIEHDWTGSQAVAKREIFDIAFKRALSFDQPDIAPSDQNQAFGLR